MMKKQELSSTNPQINNAYDADDDESIDIILEEKHSNQYEFETYSCSYAEY